MLVSGFPRFSFGHCVLIYSVLVLFVDARIHKLILKREMRTEILLSSFGFFKEGSLTLEIRKFKVDKPFGDNEIGFSFCKRGNSGYKQCWENLKNPSLCPIGKLPQAAKKKIQMVVFLLQEKGIGVKYIGDEVRQLQIKKLSNENETNKLENIPDDMAGIIPLKVDDNGYTFDFSISILNESEAGLYTLHLHNCHNLGESNKNKWISLNLTGKLVEQNANNNFLSAGEQPLATMYGLLTVLFFLTSLVWLVYLRRHRDDVFRIHYLMLALLYLKCVSFVFHATNYYYIQLHGAHNYLAIIYYIVHLLKGALLFTTIILIGAGWAFVKHVLSDKEKKIFLIVIPLQVLANVAQIIIEEREPSYADYSRWQEILLLVDLMCCGAIMFPVVWSIRHLQEAAQTDGKAALNLQKLKLFRQFYILIVVYIYFSRIIVYLLKITVPFQYEWLNELFRELATYVLFVVTGYKFRPISDNPYLRVPDSDNEEEMDEVVTTPGAMEGVISRRTISADKPDSEEEHELIERAA